jgi:arylsulfatase
LHALAEDIERYRQTYREGWDVMRRRRWERLKSLGIVDAELPGPDSDIKPGWNLSEEEMHRRIGPGEVGRAIPWDRLNDDQKSFQAVKMAIHAAMVDRMDQEIGRVLDQIKAMGAAENTLVIFASDNGASAEQMIRSRGHDPSAPPGSANSYLCLGPGWATACNTPFRLHKHYVHEGGMSTPLIVSWPKGIKEHGALRHTPGHLIDIAPTLLQLAELPQPKEFNGTRRPEMPGHSLIPTFSGDVSISRDFLYFSHSGNRALRVGDRKIVSVGKSGKWELYDLSKDRGEIHDLAASKPDVVKEMAATWLKANQTYQAEGTSGPRMPEAADRPDREAKKRESQGR